MSILFPLGVPQEMLSEKVSCPKNCLLDVESSKPESLFVIFWLSIESQLPEFSDVDLDFRMVRSFQNLVRQRAVDRRPGVHPIL